VFALTVPFPWDTDSEVSEAGVLPDPGLSSAFQSSSMAASAAQVVSRRLRHQQLIETTQRRKPAQIVSWLCAVQAQDYPAAKWAIGVRIPGCQDADVEQAFNDGLILRTHVLRPTWHFVTPEDIRWMLKLSGPRVHFCNAYYYRQLGLDDKIFKKSCALIHRVLEGGKHLTRAELAQHLKRAHIPADGLKLGYLMMHAELEGVICSGPRQGKQFTYALLDERAPGGKTLDRDEALARLATRYFASHGPATVRDFAWWSGFTLTDAQRAVEAARPALDASSIGGLVFWSADGPSERAASRLPVMLLPNYDEYLIAYKDRALVVDPERAANIAARTNGAFANHLIVDGRLAGGWSRTISANSVTIDVAPYKKLTPLQARSLSTAAEQYGEFLGLPATLSVV
jgi:hypothetical protein